MNSNNHRRTRYEHNAGGRLRRLIVENPATGPQETEWEFGVALTESDPASHDLVRRKIYPDSAGGSDLVVFGLTVWDSHEGDGPGGNLQK